jgi:MFS family permease
VFGHPRGLATLFLTEMWERFTYYGIQSILILFLVEASGRGGLGLSDKSASDIWGLYAGGTWLLSLLGGWVADRLIGGRLAIAAGGVLITAGNALLASGGTRLFFLGLIFNVLGVGLLKPNASATVGELYPEGGSRRDAGFSIFYIGINVGSLVAPMIVPVVARRYGWHAGFGLPALGMLFGVVQFLVTRRYLGRAGAAPASTRPRSWLALWIVVAVIGMLAVLTLTGAVAVDAAVLATAVSQVVGILMAAYLLYMVFFGGLTRQERSRVFAMMALFAASTVFWMAYMQMFDSFTLFAERYTDRDLFGWTVLRDRAGARVRGTVGAARAAGPGSVFAGEVRLGPAADGGRHARHVRCSAARDAWGHGVSALAHGDLLPDRLRRALPLAGRPVLHHQAGAGALRRAVHGPVVPHHRARQLPGGPVLRRLRRPPAGDSPRVVPETVLVERCRRRRDAADHAAGEAADGGRALAAGMSRP